MTKEELIVNLKIEYPALTKIFDGEEIQLNSEEYEETINAWADNQIAREAAEAAEIAKAEARVSAYTKLGLTPEEIAALPA